MFDQRQLELPNARGFEYLRRGDGVFRLRPPMSNEYTMTVRTVSGVMMAVDLPEIEIDSIIVDQDTLIIARGDCKHGQELTVTTHGNGTCQYLAERFRARGKKTEGVRTYLCQAAAGEVLAELAWHLYNRHSVEWSRGNRTPIRSISVVRVGQTYLLRWRKQTGTDVFPSVACQHIGGLIGGMPREPLRDTYGERNLRSSNSLDVLGAEIAHAIQHVHSCATRLRKELMPPLRELQSQLGDAKLGWLSYPL